MKHTFVIIDHLMIVLKAVPLALDSDTDRAKARKILVLIEEYTHTLRKLVEGHKTKKYLDRLHHSHFKEVEDWAEQVEAVFKKIDQLLIVLDEDIEKLERIIKHEPLRWQDAIARMSMGMVMTGLQNEEDILKRLRKLAVFEVHELEEIIHHKKHIQEVDNVKDIEDVAKYDRVILEFFERLLS